MGVPENGAYTPQCPNDDQSIDLGVPYLQTHVLLKPSGVHCFSARGMPPEERSFLAFMFVYDVYGFDSKILRMAQGYISSLK